MRESAAVKAKRYLLEGRVVMVTVTTDTVGAHSEGGDR